MILKVTEPAYYEKTHEIDNEIIVMTKTIAEKMEKITYGDATGWICIMPVVAPEEILAQGLWPEIIRADKLIRAVTVLKHIDYETYLFATVEDRKKLTIKCMIEALWKIRKKVGSKFDVSQCEADLLTFAGYTKEELGIETDGRVKKTTKNFSISMNTDRFNQRSVTKPLIKKLIGYVGEQKKVGNYDFLTLINNRTEAFIQTTPEKDGYYVEIRYPELDTSEKRIYVKKVLPYEETIDLFFSFYDEKLIDFLDFEDVSYLLK